MTAIANQIEEIPHQEIKLSDGCVLSARIWRPASATEQPVPAILEYLPYRKRDGTTARDALTHPYFAARGYACIRVDMRGNGDSEGVMHDEYTAQEQADAVEVIHWLAAQPWCTGNVGMMGISWGGFNSLQVAALAPTPLKAIITLCSTDDRYADDIHYKGGCLLNENLGWGATMLAYSSRPPDPALVGDSWLSMWKQRLEIEPFLAPHWLRHQHRDDYWKQGSVCENFEAISAATLAIGGWGDAYKNAVPRLVRGITGPTKAITGPWVHKYPHFAVPEPRIGFLQVALEWWDHWLKGHENGAEDWPAYRAYVMDSVKPARWYEERSGRWIADERVSQDLYPAQHWHLHDDGLSLDPCQDDFAQLVASPQDCGRDGGEYCAIWLGPELPGDQRGDDGKSVCFDGPVLQADQDIVGAPVVRMRLAPQSTGGQIAVRLCDVRDDGTSHRITYGVLNLTHYQSHETPAPLTPGEVIEVVVQLDDIAYRIPAGSRLRVAVSSAYWPLIWPAADAGALTIVGGDMTLPVRPTAQGDECDFPPPAAAEPWQTETLRAPNNRREVREDLRSGMVVHEIEDDFGKVQDKDHGLIVGSVGREKWSIHPEDPLSARGETHWTTEFEREGISARTETWSTMTCDAAHFFLSAKIEAWLNGEVIFVREFDETVKRDLV